MILKWKNLKISIAVAFLLVVLKNNVVWADNPTLGDNEEIRHRILQEEQERKEREKEKDIFLQREQKGEEDLSLPVEEPAFLISSLELEGDGLEKFPWAKEYLQKYTGKSIGREGINLIVKRLTGQFVAKGYVTTRISIPEQDLSKGALKLILIPGIIRKISFANGNANWQTAFPMRPGDILNVRDLEQGLEQMKRVPSQDVDFQIAPGEKPGESDIIISLKKEKNWRVTLSLDDSGSKATGKLQSSATFSWDNLLGINDLFYLTLNSDGERAKTIKGTKGQSINYSFPYGYWTFTLIKEKYDYHQTIDGLNEKFFYSGESESNELRIQKLITRDQKSKTHLKFRVINKSSKSYVEDMEIQVQRKNVTAAEIALAKKQYQGQGVIEMELAYRWGVPWFNAQKDPENSKATSRYALWILNSSISTPVTLGSKKGTYYFNLKAQTTNNILYAADFFSIGNRYTVRGFDGEETLAAEKGWFIRNELGIPIAQGQEMYLGLDHGEVSGPSSEGLIGKSLTGMALGLRGGNKTLNYDIFLGWPLAKPDSLETAKTCVGFQLSYQY